VSNYAIIAWRWRRYRTKPDHPAVFDAFAECRPVGSPGHGKARSFEVPDGKSPAGQGGALWGRLPLPRFRRTLAPRGQRARSLRRSVQKAPCVCERRVSRCYSLCRQSALRVPTPRCACFLREPDDGSCSPEKNQRIGAQREIHCKAEIKKEKPTPPNKIDRINNAPRISLRPSITPFPYRMSPGSVQAV
jgi:hypothetical protein